MRGQLAILQQLEAFPEDELIKELRTRPEDQWFDRKGPRVTARTLGDVMVGFANAEGGLIVRGEWPLLRRPNSFRGVRLEGTRSITMLVTGPPGSRQHRDCSAGAPLRPRSPRTS